MIMLFSLGKRLKNQLYVFKESTYNKFNYCPLRFCGRVDCRNFVALARHNTFAACGAPGEQFN